MFVNIIKQIDNQITFGVIQPSRPIPYLHVPWKYLDEAKKTLKTQTPQTPQPYLPSQPPQTFQPSLPSQPLQTFQPSLPSQPPQTFQPSLPSQPL